MARKKKEPAEGNVGPGAQATGLVLPPGGKLLLTIDGLIQMGM